MKGRLSHTKAAVIDMCGRYTGNTDESDELKTIYTAARRRWPKEEFKSGEIFPTDPVPILAFEEGYIRPLPGRWGFPGFKGKGLIINARSETVKEKPTFARFFAGSRCVIPTTGYYEWDPQKTKFRFRLPDVQELYLAGLFRPDPDGFRFVILTTAANSSTADVHPRMPLILRHSEVRLWTADPEFAARHLTDTMPSLIRMEA